MSDVREQLRVLVKEALESYGTTKLNSPMEISLDAVSVETPPDPAMGDVGFPMFSFAKMFRMAPPAIAADIAAVLSAHPSVASLGTVKPVG
ncbi:MAG TPA: arginine--tRNA ligase, partial [Treponemataceae bacterium]|nr:arginine--tRNA ligase [Treponemataceae bacterium]